MKILVLLTLSWACGAHATTAFEFNALLAQPLEIRLRECKRLKPESYAFLTKAAFDTKNSLQMRWRALTTMGRLDVSAFRKELDRALISKEWFMRNAALIALQTDDRSRAVGWSARLLEDPALVVRTQAVRNLIQLDARETEPLLWKEIFSVKNYSGKQSLWVRGFIAEALAKFTAQGRSKGFERLLIEPDERLHKWAVIGLESTTGFKMTDSQEPTETRRRKWLARLGVEEM